MTLRRLAVSLVGLALLVFSNSCAAPPESIRDSVFDFYSPKVSVDPRYGRYSYVLLSNAEGQRSRNLAFETLLLGAISPGRGLPSDVQRLQYNVFEHPVIDALFDKKNVGDFMIRDAAPSTFLNKYYDYPTARLTLDRICSVANQPEKPTQTIDREPRFCSTMMTGGPYIVTFAKPLPSGTEAVPKPLLIGDLTPFNDKAFPTIVDALLRQVRDPNLSESGRVNSTYTAVLSVTLDISDWLPNVSQKMADWFKLLAP